MTRRLQYSSRPSRENAGTGCDGFAAIFRAMRRVFTVLIAHSIVLFYRADRQRRPESSKRKVTQRSNYSRQRVTGAQSHARKLQNRNRNFSGWSTCTHGGDGDVGGIDTEVINPLFEDGGDEGTRRATKP